MCFFMVLSLIYRINEDEEGLRPLIEEEEKKEIQPMTKKSYKNIEIDNEDMNNDQENALQNGKVGHENEEDIKCDKPNTVKLARKKGCACVEGYTSTNIDVYGCYKCESKCDKNSHCVYPGKCECKVGYSSNGVSCEKNTPTILSINPKECKHGHKCLVNITISRTDRPKSYCRFGKMIVNGTITDSNIVQCYSPILQPGPFIVQVSYDSIDWSPENARFIISAYQASWSIPLSFISIVFVICCMYMISLLKEQKKTRNIEESTPFSLVQLEEGLKTNV